MLLLSAKEIQSVFSMNDTIHANEEAFKYLTQGESDSPLRINLGIEKENGKALFMPSYIEPINALGMKIVSVYPDNAKKGIPSVPATVFLMDATTGQVISVMEGTVITQMRTGAAAGVATKHLSREDSKTALVIGAGGQSKGQIEAILCARKLDTVYVSDLDYEHAQKFVQKMNEELKSYGAQIVAIKDHNEVLSTVDIVTAITTSTKPVFDSKKLKKGAHVNGVGSFTPAMQELDEHLITTCDKLYVDTKAGVLEEAGDFLVPLKNGSLKAEQITGEIGDYLLGNIKGRESDDEITVFKTVGSAELDVMAAYEIYKKAKENNVGTQIEL